ncbi:unnamed protein product [Diamesa hyperborea]
MKLVIETVTKCSGRLGLLTSIERLPNKSFKTPLMLFLNPQLSEEVLGLCGVDMEQCAVNLSVSNCEQMEEPLSLYQKGLSNFCGLGMCLTFVSLKNSSEANPSGFHEKGSVSVFKKAGKVNITPERFMDLMEVYKPDFYTSLADGDSKQDSSKKRISKSIERSEQFFEDCFNRHKTSKVLKNSSLFIASLEGGFSERDRGRMIENLKDRESDIGGYFIDGLHTNGADACVVDKEALKDIVQHSVKLLETFSKDKPRIMLGAYLPPVIIELVALGIDVFDSSFVNIVTNCNRAMVFNFDLSKTLQIFPEIDLLDSKYKDDLTPMLEGCECLACKNHTKAYVNHLLNTHELLGPMLLTIHNLHHYQLFFEAIRHSINEDKLPALIDLITSQYNSTEAKLTYELEAKVEDKNGKPKGLSHSLISKNTGKIRFEVQKKEG